MKEGIRVAILNRREYGFSSLLDDLKKSGIYKHEIFFSLHDMWVSEQKNEYDFLLIENYFFDMVKKNIAIYHLFDKYKCKTIFYCNISYNIVAENDDYMRIDLYKVFFRPFVDFDEVIERYRNEDADALIGLQDTVVDMDLEKRNGLRYEYEDSFFLKSGHSLIRFHLNEVLCLESDRNYITIYTRKEKHLIRQTLQSMLEILPDKFHQINRSVIINIDKVHKVVGNRVYIDGLNNFRPMMSNKHKPCILNAMPLFNGAKYGICKIFGKL